MLWELGSRNIVGNHNGHHCSQQQASNHTSEAQPSTGDRNGEGARVRRSVRESERTPTAKSLQATYNVESKVLGRGHYGVVRKCRHRETGEECAVKSISKRRISRPEVLKREISILRTVRHANIITIRDVFEDAHHVFIVTELCTGGELFDRIIQKTNSKEGHYSEHDAAKIIKQVLDAIAYCHQKNICHRDLKPENFLFETSESNARLKIIDFGLARIAETAGDSEKGSSSTSEESKCDMPELPLAVQMHTRVGTPYYIAPEVLMRSYTKACDLWSIGVITYILLCGYPPFNGDSDVAIFERVKQGLSPRSFPKEDWDGISTAAKDFIKKLLCLNPIERMTAVNALEDPWIVANATTEPGTTAVNALPPHKPSVPPVLHVKEHHRKKRLNGKLLAARLQNFVGLSKLKKVALNVLAHHLTEREIAELSLIWRQIDTEQRGTITIQRLRETLAQNGHNATEDEMVQLLTGIDTDGNNEIDYYEFAASLLARNQTIRDDRVEELFVAIDQRHKGYIELEDLSEIMGSTEHAREVLGNDFPPDGKMDLTLFRKKLASL